MTERSCAIVYRIVDGAPHILAFEHPIAGRQLVKGGIEPGETARDAAIRELREESGIEQPPDFRDLGTATIGEPPSIWHFHAARIDGLPERWDHRTEDDGGHVFRFFWHPLGQEPDDSWHVMFRHALAVVDARLPAVLA